MNRDLLTNTKTLCLLLAAIAVTACGKAPNEPLNLQAFPHQLPEAPIAFNSPLNAPAWLSGHPIAADNERVFVADRDNGVLAILDAQSLELLKQVPVGDYPEQLVVGPAGEAWVVS